MWLEGRDVILFVLTPVSPLLTPSSPCRPGQFCISRNVRLLSAVWRSGLTAAPAQRRGRRQKVSGSAPAGIAHAKGCQENVRPDSRSSASAENSPQALTLKVTCRPPCRFMVPHKRAELSTVEREGTNNAPLRKDRVSRPSASAADHSWCFTPQVTCMLHTQDVWCSSPRSAECATRQGVSTVS